MRSFAQTYPTQKWCVYRHYPDAHFFVSCVDDEQAHTAEQLRKDCEHVHIERYTDPELPEIPQELGAHAPYGNATTHGNLLLQHWGNQRVWEYFLKEAKDISTFNAFIRIRPDNWFHKFVPPEFFVDIERYDASSGDASGFVRIYQRNVAHCPWWGRFGGVNDRFAVMGWDAANAYFRTYERIHDLMARGCPFHPESLTAASLAQDGVIVKPLMAEFSTHRLHPDPRPHRPPEIMAGDIADLILNR